MISFLRKISRRWHAQRQAHQDLKFTKDLDNRPNLMTDKQHLYEQWASKELWLLHTEGLPLLLGLDPSVSIPQDAYESWIKLKQHATDCVKRGLLKIANQNLKEQEWQVEPVVLYRWAIVSQIALPNELDNLMGFIMKAVKTDASAVKSDTESTNELILGRALAGLYQHTAAYIDMDDGALSQMLAEQIIHRYDADQGVPSSVSLEQMQSLIRYYLTQFSAEGK